MKIRQNKKARKPIGLKWHVFGGFGIFAAFILALLFIFQVVLLDPTYRLIKESQIKSAAESVLARLTDMSDSSCLETIAQQQDLCAEVVKLSDLSKKNETTANETLSVHQVPECVIHKIPDEILKKYVSDAKNNGGSIIRHFDRTGTFGKGLDSYDEEESTTEESSEAEKSSEELSEEKSLPAFDQPKEGPFNGNPMPTEPKENVFDTDVQMPESLVYVKIGNLSDGTAVAVILNTNATPVHSTIITLRMQLLVLSICLLIGGLIISFFISKSVTKPLVELEKQSATLATGERTAPFTAGNFAEVQRLSEALNFAKKEIDKTDRLRRELIANVSHDLRTPLTMISGTAEMMLDLPGEMNEENLRAILEESNRLSTLVTTLLDVSKLESGAVKMEKERYSISEQVAEICHRYAVSPSFRNNHFVPEIEEGLTVFADRIKIDRVICNLVNNAITYTGADGFVGIGLHSTNDGILIEVRDTGKGIAPEEIDQIWDRYYRSNDEHKRAKIGSGLGLSIVRNVVRAHGGKCGVRSALNEGSVFWIIIPKELD